MDIIKKNKLAVFIILCMIFLRIWRLEDFAMFLADQGRDAIIIRRIVTLSHLPLIGPPSSIGQVYLGPFFYYLGAPFLFLFSFNPVGLAYGVSIVSIIGLLLLVVIIKKDLKEKAALVFLVLSAFSYQLIWFSRFSWNPNLLPIFAFFTIFFTYKAFTAKKLYYSLLYGIFFGLSFQLHHLAAFLALPLAMGFLYGLIFERQKKRLLLSVCVAICAFILISSPLIIFDLKHDFLNTRNLISLFTKQNVVAGGSWITRIIETNHAFMSSATQINLPPLLFTVISLLLLVGCIFVIRKAKHGMFVLLNTANVFSFLYLFSLLSSPRHPHYFGSIYLSFYFILAYLITRLKPKIMVVCALLLIGVYISVNARHYTFITGKAFNQINFARTIADSIKPYTDTKPFNFATYPIEFTSEDTFLYFLENDGYRFANREKREVTDQMFVLCDREPCRVLNSQSWNIEMFGKAKIDTMWKINGIKIYRLVHE